MTRRRVTRGMVLAAGLGTRMRPLTDRLPKPMVEVAGRTLIDRVLDHFAAAGIADVVVNIHHKGKIIAGHLERRTEFEITLSPEDELLETGGGVARALGHLGAGPFAVANADAFWLDGYLPAIDRLAAAWDGRRMDALILLYPTAVIVGYGGRGDYFMDAVGRAARRREGEVAPFVFTGVQLLHPRLFEGGPEGRFSLNLLYDKAEAAHRLFGLRHDGVWFHVGTAESIGVVEAWLAGRDPATRWV